MGRQPTKTDMKLLSYDESYTTAEGMTFSGRSSFRRDLGRPSRWSKTRAFSARRCPMPMEDEEQLSQDSTKSTLMWTAGALAVVAVLAFISAQ
jgi:hypothetical protein